MDLLPARLPSLDFHEFISLFYFFLCLCWPYLGLKFIFDTSSLVHSDPLCRFVCLPPREYLDCFGNGRGVVPLGGVDSPSHDRFLLLFTHALSSSSRALVPGAHQILVSRAS